MSTLTALKATIADDLARSDMGSQIAAAITAAITHYKTTRFYFNETRGSTFTTVASQSRYTSADDADIPLWFDLDDVFVNDGTREICLSRYDPVEMEYLENILNLLFYQNIPNSHCKLDCHRCYR